jgi:hypothetical protein
LNYVINGVKATKAEFNALDPGLIYSIEIIPAEQAKTIYDGIDNKHSVLFVTTNDSESGKKFKEKIDKLYRVNVSGSNSASVSSSTGVVAVNTSSGNGVSINAEATHAPVADSQVITIVATPHSYSLAAVAKDGGKGKVDTIIVNGKPTLYKRYEPYTVAYSSDSLYKVSSDVKPMVYTIKSRNNIAYAKTFAPGKLYITSDSNAETNIEHLSSKMIMIDGKEATAQALKKLSAADIESMNVKSGEEVIKKYGDKAKNGVVFITTKKAKK